MPKKIWGGVPNLWIYDFLTEFGGGLMIFTFVPPDMGGGFFGIFHFLGLDFFLELGNCKITVFTKEIFFVKNIILVSFCWSLYFSHETVIFSTCLSPKTVLDKIIWLFCVFSKFDERLKLWGCRKLFLKIIQNSQIFRPLF